MPSSAPCTAPDANTTKRRWRSRVDCRRRRVAPEHPRLALAVMTPPHPTASSRRPATAPWRVNDAGREASDHRASFGLKIETDSAAPPARSRPPYRRSAPISPPATLNPAARRQGTAANVVALGGIEPLAVRGR